MSTKQLIIAILLILVLICSGWFYRYWTYCEGCGGCGYKKFTDHVIFEKTICENDSICMIYLKSLTKNYSYEIYLDEFKQIETDFDKKDITDISKKYIIHGDQISHGTCAPYSIDKIILDKK